MFHPSLEQQMAALNLDSATLPDAGQWTAFLESISSRFEQYEHERAALQASETRFRQIIEHFGDAVYLADLENTNVHYINPAFEKIYGVDRDSMYREPVSLLPLLHPDDASLVTGTFAEFRRDPKPMDFEHRLLAADGETHWVRARIFPFVDETGSPLLAGLTEDITERKQFESTMREREYFIQQALNVVPNMVYVLDLKQGRNTYVNPFMARFYGLTEEQIYQSDHTEQFVAATHPDEIPRINAIFENRWDSVRDGEVLTLEYRVRNAAGEWRWIHTREVVFSRAADGAVDSILGVAVDITEQKQAEDSLRRSEALLRLIGEHISDTISYVRNDQTEYISPSVERMLGYSPELWLANNARDTWSLTHPEDVHILQEIATRSTEGTIRFEYRCRHAAGHFVWLETVFTRVADSEGKPAQILVSRDITERKQMEQALRDSQQLLARINDIVPCSIWVFDLEKNHDIYVNPYLSAFFGHTLPELQELGMPFLKETTHPEDTLQADEFDRGWQDTSDDSIRRRVLRMRNTQGEYRWLEISEVVFNRSHEGSVSQVLGIAFDITDRKRMEDALRQNQEWLQAIMDNMPVLLDAFDEHNNIIFWNRECERVTGYTAAEVSSSPDPLSLLYPDADYLTQAKAEAKASLGNYRDREWTLTCKDGSQRTISWSNVSGSVSIPGWSSWGIGIDVTEQRKAEQALRQSEAHLRFIAENMNDIVSYSDLNGGLSYTSASIKHVVGITADVWRSMSFEERMSYVHPDDRAEVLRVITSLRESGQTGRYEHRFRHADGHDVHLETEVNCAVTPGGTLGVIYVTRNISERRLAEQALRTSEERLRFITENIDDIVSFSITPGIQQYTNPAVTQSMGFSPEEWSDVPEQERLNRLHPDDRERVSQALKTLREPGQVVRFEYRTRHRDGHYVIFETSMRSVETPDRNGVGLISVSRDISERRLAEQALRTSEERLRFITEHIDDVVSFSVLNGAHEYTNPAIAKALGFSPEEWAAMGHEEHRARLHPDDYERVVAVLDGLREPGQTARCEYRTRHRDGHYVYFEASMRCLEMIDRNAVGLLMVSRDNTDRQMAEQALRQSEERFRRLIENLPVGISVQDRDDNILLCNRSACDLLGLTEDQLMGRSSFDPRWNAIMEDGRPFDPSQHPSVRALASGQPVRGVVMGVYRPESGDRVWLLVSAEPEVDADGNVFQVVVNFSDITERRLAEQAIRDSESRFRLLIENLQVGVLLHGPNAEVLLCNPEALRLMGVSDSQITGAEPYPDTWKVVHEDGSPFPCDTRPVQQAIATRQPVRDVVMGVYHAADEMVWLLVNAEPQFDSTGNIRQVICTFIDITARREAEAQRHELETKRRTLGNLRRFLNDVTHDLRTPLSVINTSLYLLQRRMSAEERSLRYMQSIDEQVAHLIRIVEDMTDMSQLDYEQANIRLAPSNVNALVAMVASTFEENSGGKRQRLILNRSDLLPPVMADEALLARALRYILSNAIIYTPPEGDIAISTLRRDNQVVIEVRDTGMGIEDIDLPHIFEPFYRGDKSRTISEAGTGLGLTMALEIVEAHGGSIAVQTTPGQGSTFSICLDVK
jgi:PAS domain S-box-containing protein